MRNLTVIPVIDEILTERCLKSIAKPNSAAGMKPEDILVVDNTKHGIIKGGLIRVHRDKENHNLGVARSWNIGVKAMRDGNYDYLTLMSQSMLFGPMKETTWIRQMETFNGANCIESDGHSWHLIAFHKRVFDLIGDFDENFYPGYFEAIDFGYRMRMLNIEGGWPRVWVNALSMTVGNHTDLVLAPPLLQYYRDKWGGDKGEETFKLPFGDKPLGYYPNNSIPKLAEKYGLQEWW